MSHGPVYEKGRYWVSPSRKAGFDIFEIRGCASVVVAQYHVDDGMGLNWCKREIDRRIEKAAALNQPEKGK
jgi:hypothetical protein